jgi:hypothetical protein
LKAKLKRDISTLLDPFIPDPDVHERHEITIRAPVAIVFDTVYKFDLQSIWMVRRIFWLGAKLLRARVQARGATEFIAEMLHLGWERLAEERNHFLIAGAVVSLGKPA